MDEVRPRLLLIGQPPGVNGTVAASDVVPVAADPAEVARHLRESHFNAVLACPIAFAELLDRFRRDELIVGHIDKGLAVLDPAGTILWANAAFTAHSHAFGNPVGQSFLTMLGGGRVASIERVEGNHQAVHAADPLEPARLGRPTSLRLHCLDNPDQPFLEVDLRPASPRTEAWPGSSRSSATSAQKLCSSKSWTLYTPPAANSPASTPTASPK